MWHILRKNKSAKSEPQLDIMVLAFDVLSAELHVKSESILWTLCLKDVFGVVGELRVSSYIRLTESIAVWYILLERVIFSIAN